jgi:SAM-dependent methyltransferase
MTAAEVDPFAQSGAFYDALYEDKNYAGEAAYIDGLIRRHSPDASAILEMGCGTGIHAALLAERGYAVHGFDISAPMLDAAAERHRGLPSEVAERLRFAYGDMRSYRCDGRFDAVLSVFHVVCYQVDNADLLATFHTARQHLRPGGLFIFDAWYGPAVLRQRPEAREKHAENEAVRVRRLCHPELLVNDNRVDVHFTYQVEDKHSDQRREIVETHRVRYLFQPEVAHLLDDAGITLVAAEEWMTGAPPGENTWGVCFVGRRS